MQRCQTGTLTIEPTPPLVITSPSPCCTAGSVGTPYAQNVFADGGIQPYTWSIASGQLPPGLSLDCPSPPASFAGMPTTAGTYTFTLRVTDARGSQATAPGSITIQPSSSPPPSLSVAPTCVAGGSSSTGTVRLSAPAPAGGTLQPGDVVVTNIGANYTGKSLVRFAGGVGPGSLFGTTAAGPAAEAFNATGNDWVANFTGNNIQIFGPNGGAAAVTITSPKFKKPWGQAFNGGVHNPHDGSVLAFFSSNFVDGTIDRIDVVPVNGKPTFKVFQIGKLPTTTTSAVPFVSAQGMAWIPRWTYYGQTYHDVLLVVDPFDNRIAAYPNSSTTNTTSTPITDRGITVFEGAPLNTPAGLALNPLNSDLLVVNQLNNNLVEIGPPTQGNDDQVVAVRTLDPAKVNQKTGAGSSLFGVAATTDAAGNLKVYFTDDNTNTLDALTVSAS